MPRTFGFWVVNLADRAQECITTGCNRLLRVADDPLVRLGGIDIQFIPRHSLKPKTGDDAISTLTENEEAHRLIDRMSPNATGTI